jgi:hypothetical protein
MSRDEPFLDLRDLEESMATMSTRPRKGAPTHTIPDQIKDENGTFRQVLNMLRDNIQAKLDLYTTYGPDAISSMSQNFARLDKAAVAHMEALYDTLSLLYQQLQKYSAWQTSLPSFSADEYHYKPKPIKITQPDLFRQREHVDAMLRACRLFDNEFQKEHEAQDIFAQMRAMIGAIAAYLEAQRAALGQLEYVELVPKQSKRSRR